MDMELLQRAQMMQQQSQQIEQSLDVIDQQIAELEEFNESLRDLENSKEKEILANLGKGVMIKSEIKEKDLFVEVGAGIIVKKNPQEAQEVISGQLKKFRDVKIQLLSQMEEFKQEFGRMAEDIEKMKLDMGKE